MTRQFGGRATFAVEVGGTATPGLRVVDLWAAGRRLTVDDNAAHAPSLSYYMRMDAQRVRRHEIPACPFPGREPGEIFRLLHADETEMRQRFWFMRWSEILDNVSTYAYLDDDLVIVFEFWGEAQVFAARIPSEKFVAVIDDATDLLALHST
jgi:hypothetical protein